MVFTDYFTSTVILIALEVILGLLFLLKRHAKGPTYQGLETMVGKTVIVTGGNTGIGKATVEGLAMRGARVIMGCRDMQKAEEACQEIITLTNNKYIECRKLDLASFESIRAFAKSVLETEPKIDVLINNAGIFFSPKSVTKDGLEMHMGINHFGHFLLTNLLLGRLKQSAPSRIINVSSEGHRYGFLDFGDLDGEKNFGRFDAYARSKLANCLHALELSKRLKGTGVTANSQHPGVVATEIFRNNTWENSSLLTHRLLSVLIFLVRKPFFKTPWQGAQTALRMAIDPKLEKVTGKYFSDMVEKLPSPNALNEADAKRLWEISEATTGAKKGN